MTFNLCKMFYEYYTSYKQKYNFEFKSKLMFYIKSLVVYITTNIMQ